MSIRGLERAPQRSGRPDRYAQSLRVRDRNLSGAIDPHRLVSGVSSLCRRPSRSVGAQEGRHVLHGCIRCEKATTLRQRGFESVYHLKGGILKYLETAVPEESRWEGRCFVFRRAGQCRPRSDPRRLCFVPRLPHARSPADQQSPRYREGVCCPRRRCPHARSRRTPRLNATGRS